MMGVVVVVYAAFGLTESEAKTEIVCKQTKGVPEATAIFNVEAAGQVHNQTNELVYTLEGTSTRTPTGPSTSIGAYPTYSIASESRSSNCVAERALPSSSTPGAKNRGTRDNSVQLLYGCVTWKPRACHYDKVREGHHSFLTRYIGWLKNNRTDHPISCEDAP